MRNAADKSRQNGFKLGLFRLRRVYQFANYALNILGIAFTTEIKFAIAFRLLLHIFNQPRRLPDADHQHAGGERIEGSRTANFVRSCEFFHAIDNIARRPTRRLVDIEETKHEGSVVRVVVK